MHFVCQLSEDLSVPMVIGFFVLACHTTGLSTTLNPIEGE